MVSCLGFWSRQGRLTISSHLPILDGESEKAI